MSQYISEPGTNRSSGEPLLAITDLQVGLSDAPRAKPIIDGMSLHIHAGEVVALVGESGSGKSMTALSLMQLLPTGIATTGGRILFDGQDILRMTPAQLNRLRGGRIAMLFQQPQAMLDPTARVGTQVAEPIRVHRHVDRSSARSRVLELLHEVGIPDPQARAECFSHELSGGMAQRVMIAAALSANPDLLIADEPTTALDVTVQAQILKLLDDERRQRKLAVLLITHDLSIVSALADRIAVMYAGRIVEEGPTRSILNAPQHPYTRALVQCSLLKADEEGHLFSIPGGVSQAREMEQGCRFHTRCATAASPELHEQCTHSEPTLHAYNDCCKARCWAVKTASPSSAAPGPAAETHEVLSR